MLRLLRDSPGFPDVHSVLMLAVPSCTCRPRPPSLLLWYSLNGVGCWLDLRLALVFLETGRDCQTMIERCVSGTLL